MRLGLEGNEVPLRYHMSYRVSVSNHINEQGGKKRNVLSHSSYFLHLAYSTSMCDIRLYDINAPTLKVRPHVLPSKQSFSQSYRYTRHPIQRFDLFYLSRQEWFFNEQRTVRLESLR